MLGYCGINCDTCPAYQGTVNTRIELLKKAAQEYGEGKTAAKDWVCLGCSPADQKILATYCATCGIRTCAIDKGVQNCAACTEYDTCEKIKQFLEGDAEELRQRMGWLRERFKALEG
jgi:hypothetical protein